MFSLEAIKKYGGYVTRDMNGKRGYQVGLVVAGVPIVREDSPLTKLVYFAKIPSCQKSGIPIIIKN